MIHGIVSALNPFYLAFENSRSARRDVECAVLSAENFTQRRAYGHGGWRSAEDSGPYSVGGYNLSNSSITFSMPLTTSVKRS
jgi:hypothetical protein